MYTCSHRSTSEIQQNVVKMESVLIFVLCYLLSNSYFSRSLRNLFGPIQMRTCREFTTCWELFCFKSGVCIFSIKTALNFAWSLLLLLGHESLLRLRLDSLFTAKKDTTRMKHKCHEGDTFPRECVPHQRKASVPSCAADLIPNSSAVFLARCGRDVDTM